MKRERENSREEGWRFGWQLRGVRCWKNQIPYSIKMSLASYTHKICTKERELTEAWKTFCLRTWDVLRQQRRHYVAIRSTKNYTAKHPNLIAFQKLHSSANEAMNLSTLWINIASSIGGNGRLSQFYTNNLLSASTPQQLSRLYRKKIQS